MTDKQYLISKKEIDETIFSMEGAGKPINEIIDILQSLPMVSAEPVAWAIRIGNSPNWSYCDTESDADFYGKRSVMRYEKKPLFASPQALTPITADDVTDEMVKSYINEAKSIDIATANINKSIMAAAYNAVIKNRSEA